MRNPGFEDPAKRMGLESTAPSFDLRHALSRQLDGGKLFPAHRTD